MKRIVITHPEWGIYVGNALGLGFWSLLDTAGQDCVPTFETEEQARNYIASWESNNDPEAYSYVETDCSADLYATCDELEAVGLADLMGDMRDNHLANTPALGRA